MSWSSVVGLADSIAVGPVEVLSGAFSLDPDRTAHIWVASDIAGVTVRAYSSLDGTTWDGVPAVEFTMGGVAESFVLRDYYMVRLGFVSPPGPAVVTASMRVFDRTG